MDMIAPSGTAQSEALSYTADEPVTLPYVELSSGETDGGD